MDQPREHVGQNGCLVAIGEKVVLGKVVCARRGCSYKVMLQPVDSIFFFFKQLVCFDKNYNNYNYHLGLFIHFLFKNICYYKDLRRHCGYF